MRAALINRALDHDISHFDSSRFYSDGLSEVTLGRVLGARRQSVTISTKFGLLPTPLIGSMGAAAWLFRKARSALSRLKVSEYPKRSYSAATMRRALQDSLRALRTDYIDIYHLHEPLPDTQLTLDLLEELERAKKAGEIRLIGISGDDIDPLVSRHGNAFDVIQTAEARWSEAGLIPDITYSLFSSRARGSAGAIPPDSVRALLQTALRRRPQGAVIVQTRSPHRLSQLVEFAQGC